MADEEKTCKNPPCTCPPQPDGKYCSASCEGAGKTIEIDCDCGHETCQWTDVRASEVRPQVSERRIEAELH